MGRRSEGLLRLLQVADSAFPVGGFAHSNGYEAGRQLGWISGFERLRSFAWQVLDNTAGQHIPFVDAAWRAERHRHAAGPGRGLQRLAALAEASLAFSSAVAGTAVARRAAESQGACWLNTAKAVFGINLFEEADADGTDGDAAGETCWVHDDGKLSCGDSCGGERETSAGDTESPISACDSSRGGATSHDVGDRVGDALGGDQAEFALVDVANGNAALLGGGYCAAATATGSHATKLAETRADALVAALQQGEIPLPLPVVFGAVAARLDIGLHDCLLVYLHGTLRNLLSAAVREGSLGREGGALRLQALQHEIHQWIPSLLPPGCDDEGSGPALCVESAAVRHFLPEALQESVPLLNYRLFTS